MLIVYIYIYICIPGPLSKSTSWDRIRSPKSEASSVLSSGLNLNLNPLMSTAVNLNPKP